MVVVVRMIVWLLIVFILALMFDWPMSSVALDMAIAACGAALYSFLRWSLQ